MKKMLWWSPAIACALALSACSSMEGDVGRGLELQRARSMTPIPPEFNHALYNEYINLSQSEYTKGDYRDSDFYALRAHSAALGAPIQPTEMGSRKIAADKSSELATYRDRVTTAMGNGSKQRMPGEAARTLAMFDCWAEEVEENRQPGDIATCRSGFLASLAKIEVVPTPPPPPPIVENFTIYFPFNGTGLTPGAKYEIERIVERARAINAKTIVVAGHTDRSGSDPYNMRLSQKREATVHDAIHRLDVDLPIESKALGESDPAKPTADGMREPDNRRVMVTISQ